MNHSGGPWWGCPACKWGGYAECCLLLLGLVVLIVVVTHG